LDGVFGSDRLLFEALEDMERKLDEEQIHPSGRAAGARSGLV
jgi:hypothetical protein